MTLDTDSIINPPRSARPILSEAVIRSRPEDFEVEEIPVYRPCGAGEHLFLWLEKRDVSAGRLLTLLSRMLTVPSRDIGVAGQKDRIAVTRQFVSVPGSCASRLTSRADGSLRILSAIAHKNKLRTGHVAGNQFRIVLRPGDSRAFSLADLSAVQRRLDGLSRSGFPNYFGPQRFGIGGCSVFDGVKLLHCSTDGSRKRIRRNRLNRLLASAVQSAVFNRVLALRVADGTYGVPQDGDVVCRRDGIRPFLFEKRGDTAGDDLVPMGPMPGPKMMPASGETLRREQAAHAELNLPVEMFSHDARLTPGARRKLMEFPRDVSADLNSDGSIETCFTLSSGSYATVLLSEIADVRDASRR